MFDFLFNNAGKKLKTISYILVILGIIVSIIAGIGICFATSTAMGIIVIIAGPLLFWVISLPLYGFGIIVENNEKQQSSLNRKL
ncbi:MAG: hypothetical protein IJX09_03245 [Clostridia bacterium]|nr:hypothetical protein [Clostridia bacterium]